MSCCAARRPIRPSRPTRTRPCSTSNACGGPERGRTPFRVLSRCRNRLGSGSFRIRPTGSGQNVNQIAATEGDRAPARPEPEGARAGRRGQRAVRREVARHRARRALPGRHRRRDRAARPAVPHSGRSGGDDAGSCRTRGRPRRRPAQTPPTDSENDAAASTGRRSSRSIRTTMRPPRRRTSSSSATLRRSARICGSRICPTRI